MDGKQTWGLINYPTWILLENDILRDIKLRNKKNDVLTPVAKFIDSF